ncbi:MAG: InlB B-repeat-containing protein [Lachnospiraceae bacterium]|nr:InlB B-repeat-containing protein [Lachnospiraceae bacterium]
MRRRKREWKRRALVMLAALIFCLAGILEWPGFQATAQAATLLLFRVTVTGGKGAEVADPSDSVNPKTYDTTFTCQMGKYVKLYDVPDPAPDFQKFDHWHATVGVRISNNKITTEFYYEEDLTDFCFRPDLTKFTEEEQRSISAALKNSLYTVQGKVTVQAQYVDNYWLVNFDPKGGEGTMEAEKVNKGQSYELPECTFTKAGHDFAGWKLGETVYQPGESVDVTEDVTLEAQWTLKSYAIALTSSAEAWGEVSGAGTYAHGTTVTVTASGKTYDGTDYGFLYWKDCDANEIVSREASYTFTVTGTRTLEAKFSPYVYVIFQSGEAGADPEQEYVLAGKEYVLPECPFTRPGWRFAGWRFPDDHVVLAGETVTVEGQTYVTATWEEIPELTIPIDEEHFPDPGFRNYVKSTEINKNGDEFLTSGELAISSMTIQSDSVLSINGIQYFYELNALKLSNLSALKELTCNGCPKLISLTIEGCPLLEKADVGWNPALETLTLHSLPALKELRCNNGKLKVLNVDGLSALENLHCEANELTALDVSKNTNLSCLVCTGNQIDSLDVSNNQALVILWCEDNLLTEIDVSENLLLESLTVDKNGLTSLDVSGNKKLDHLTCGNNPITVLSVTGLPDLRYFDCLNCDALVSLTLDNLPSLTTAYVGKSESLTLGKTALVSLNCKAKHLDVSRANNLKTLECYSAGLESVVFGESNYKLKNVNLSGNLLTEIDLYDLTGLEQLNLSSNQLRELDVFMNTKLTQLYCNDNQLRYLQTHNNPTLSYLDCTQNLIRALDVSGNSRIKDARGTKLLCDDNVVLYTTAQDHCYVSINVTPEGSGVAYGEIQWIIGETVSLFAEAKEGYRFCHWLEGEEVVCEEPVYEFVGEKGRRLTAVFEEKLYDANLFIDKKSLTLYDTIAIDFKVPAAALEGYHDPYLSVTQNEATDVVSDFKIVGDYYVFTYRVAPHQMGDLVTAVPAALNADEKEVLGVPMEYSVAQYCQNMLGKETYQTDAYATFRRLLVDILLYGEAAQKYVNYKTDKLVSGFLTYEQRAMGTDVGTAMTYQSVKEALFATVDEEIALASIETAALYLEAAVSVQFKYLAGDLTDLRVVVTGDEAGMDVLGEYVADASLIDNKGRYYVTFGGLNAGQMRKTIYATVMRGNVKVSNTYRYSIESYAESVKGKYGETLDNLLDAMMRYGDSAAAFVAQN